MEACGRGCGCGCSSICSMPVGHGGNHSDGRDTWFDRPVVMGVTRVEPERGVVEFASIQHPREYGEWTKNWTGHTP